MTLFFEVSTLRTSYVNSPHEAGQAPIADGVGGAVGGADGDRLLARRRGHPQAALPEEGEAVQG